MKKVIGWLAIAFVLFYVIRFPENSAAFVHSVGNALGNAASSLATFIGSLV
jgi:ABC-type uncharacterized transport system permease subunit